MNEESLHRLKQLHPEILAKLGFCYLTLFLFSIFVGLTLWQRRDSLHFGKVIPLEIPLPIGLAGFLFLLGNLFLLKSGLGLILAIVGVFLIFYSAKIPWKTQLGLHQLSTGALLGLILALGLGILIPIGALNFVSLFLCQLVGYPITMQPGVELFFRSNSPYYLANLIVLVVIAAPLTEELLFRGFLYPLLKRHFSTSFAILFSALLFSAMHQHLPTAIPLFALGAAFAIAYEYTGSLPLCMGLHAIFNGSTVITLLYLKPYLRDTL